MMCMDKVFVHMIDTYYSTGKAVMDGRCKDSKSGGTEPMSYETANAATS